MSIFISASMIDDYLSCSRKPYYRINKPDVKVDNREMTLGNITHKTIELHWSNEDKARDYANTQLDILLPSDKSAKLSMEGFMDNFFQHFVAYVTPKDSIEKNFKIPFQGDSFIVGKMDRITPDSVIFDWKTTKNPPTDISKNVQFTLYNWAYKNVFGKSPSGVYYAALVNGKLLRYKHDDFIENLLINEIIPEVIQNIKNKKFKPDGIFKRSCYRCPYSLVCLKEIGYDVVDNPAFTEKW